MSGYPARWQDAEEFLNFCLSRLDEELGEALGGASSSPISQIFRGACRSRVVCGTCNTVAPPPHCTIAQPLFCEHALTSALITWGALLKVAAAPLPQLLLLLCCCSAVAAAAAAAAGLNQKRSLPTRCHTQASDQTEPFFNLPLEIPEAEGAPTGALAVAASWFSLSAWIGACLVMPPFPLPPSTHQ